ncbi:hypothetical protein AXFE_15780 [Acidithrix ferrooxidans]|uniref:Uncharacterized protein n=1 Tax=Acidithrix ferrooxidans TaxID=1280514 RepID=A0A0D8HI41_9ACTN|nr:hypothetical protein AXFE_15780 [Acidithrix ferrooxidans]
MGHARKAPNGNFRSNKALEVQSPSTSVAPAGVGTKPFPTAPGDQLLPLRTSPSNELPLLPFV